MVENINSRTTSIHRGSLGKRMLLGGGIALVLIIVFLFPVEPNPEWPKLWMIRPLIVLPVAGSMGGLFYHLMGHLRNRGGWRKLVANVVSLIVYIIALWMGTVVGLDGTLWD
jgi:hypothetical protein